MLYPFVPAFLDEFHRKFFTSAKPDHCCSNRTRFQVGESLLPFPRSRERGHRMSGRVCRMFGVVSGIGVLLLVLVVNGRG